MILLLRKPLIKRDKGDTLSLLVQMYVCIYICMYVFMYVFMYVPGMYYHHIYFEVYSKGIRINRVRLPILLVVS